MRHSLSAITLLASCLVLAATTPASAEEAEPNRGSKDRFSISVGTFLVRFDTTVRVDSETLGRGTEIDLEEDTNLDREQTDVRLDGYYRIGKRHRLDYGAIFFSREASRTIDRTIQFGDTVFDVNGFLSTRFKNDVLKLAYRYSFVRNPRVEAGLTLGVSAFVVDLGMTGETAGGGAVSEETEDFVAPIPVLGLHADVALGKSWFFRTAGEFFDVSIDDREGSLSDVRAAFDWYPFKHVGFGVGFNRLRITYADLSAAEVDLTYAYSGTIFYLTYVN